MIRIDRCLCLGRSFADLLNEAGREGLTVEEVMQRPRCNGRARCGLCRPYLVEAWRTGQTVFHEVLVAPTRRS